MEIRKSAPGNEPWRIQPEGVTSLEQKKSIKLANKLIELVLQRHDHLYTGLDLIREDDLGNIDRKEAEVGIIRFEKDFPMGKVNGYEYDITLRRQDRLDKSKEFQDVLQGVDLSVPVGELVIELSPAN